MSDDCRDEDVCWSEKQYAMRWDGQVDKAETNQSVGRQVCTEVQETNAKWQKPRNAMQCGLLSPYHTRKWTAAQIDGMRVQDDRFFVPVAVDAVVGMTKLKIYIPFEMAECEVR